MSRSSKKTVAGLADRYRIDRPKGFRITDVDPADTAGLAQAEFGSEALAHSVDRLADLQERLRAEDRWSVLIVIQAMDAAGKDSTIEHVMSGVNPAGCQVFSFRAPSSEELDHDFLWRHVVCLPERRRIGIFNRSWYEEVLIVRVHPAILASQRVPPELVGRDVWKERFESINAFERHLARNGVLVLKFFLHVSKEEQRRRFLERIEQPSKNWKFQLADVEQRDHWDEYMRCYEKMIRHTSTQHARWYVVPADHKGFTRLAVATAVVSAIDALDPRYPPFDRSKRKDLALARRKLLDERR